LTKSEMGRVGCDVDVVDIGLREPQLTRLRRVHDRRQHRRVVHTPPTATLQQAVAPVESAAPRSHKSSGANIDAFVTRRDGSARNARPWSSTATFMRSSARSTTDSAASSTKTGGSRFRHPRCLLTASLRPGHSAETSGGESRSAWSGQPTILIINRLGAQPAHGRTGGRRPCRRHRMPQT
jgi:hypothetical protein